MNEWLRIISEPVNPVQVTLELPGIEYFLPIAIICGVCVLATIVWILAVQEHLSRDDHARQDQSARRHRPGQYADGRRISVGMSESLMNDTAPMGAGTSATVHALANSLQARYPGPGQCTQAD